MFKPVGSKAKLTPQASIDMSEQNAREAHSSFDSVDHGFKINHGKTLTVTPKFLEQEPAGDANHSAHDYNTFQQKSDIVISNTEKTRKEQSSCEQSQQQDDDE